MGYRHMCPEPVCISLKSCSLRTTVYSKTAHIIILMPSCAPPLPPLTHHPPNWCLPSVPQQRAPRLRLCDKYPAHHLQTVSQAFPITNQRRARSVHTSSRLKMARRIIALRDEDIVIDAAFQGLEERDRRTHEFLFDLAEALEAGLELEVVIT